MPFYIGYVAISCIIALLNIWVGLYSLRQANMPEGRIMAFTIWTSAGTTLMFVVLTVTDSADLAFLSVRLRFIGLSLIGPLFLFLALGYTQKAHWLTRRRAAAILALPIFTLAILWSPLAIPHFFAEWNFVRLDGWSTEARIVGVWYNIHTVYSIIMFTAAVALLAQYAVRVDSSKRAAVMTILAGTMVGLPGTAAPFLLGPPPGVRSTPISLGLLTLFIGWSFTRSAATTLMPVAYDLIFASMQDAALLLDLNQRVISANPACAAMFRVPVADLLNRPVRDLLQLPEGTPLAGTERANLQLELHSDDNPLTCQVQCLPLMRHGISAGRLIVIRDVTAQNQAMELSLERERSRVLAKFIEDASHEFRTPLSVIKSSAYLAGKQREPSAAQRHLDLIDQQADRVTGLISDLQMMTVLDSNRPLQRTPVDLRDVVSSAADGYARQMADAKRQTLTVNVMSDIPVVQGDSAELCTALHKVVENAVRYTPEQGEIGISLERDGRGVVLNVRDNGVGMDEATSQAALRVFYRLDSARTMAGFGLGLPIAQRIIERHGGTLSITSVVGAGTTVTMRLPA